MAENNALARQGNNGLSQIKNYMLSPEVKDRFAEMMGPNGIYYLNQVMILVSNSSELQKCDPKSILISAMRAASLRLSVDPGQGQAWIIPYKGTATFQLGYKGVYELALRTNLYRFINVIDVYEGETITENRMTGLHTLSGQKTSERVIARMLYFELASGFKKTFVMTVEEIEAHARHYSQGYNSPRSKWHDEFERPKMERKTVLVNGLRRWGRFNANDAEIINEIENEQGWIDRGDLPDEGAVTLPAQTQRSYGQTMNELGFPGEPEPVRRVNANVETGEIIEPGGAPEEPPMDEPPASTLPPLRCQPEQLKARIATTAKSNTEKLTNGKKGLVAQVLESCLSQNLDPKAARKQLLVYLIGKDSLSDATDNEVIALYRWLSPTKDETSGEWFADAMSAREAVAAFNACQPDQASMF